MSLAAGRYFETVGFLSASAQLSLILLAPSS